MREHRYYSDAMANYIVLKCPEGAREDYQYRMLAVNHINGLLPCIHRRIDGEEFLYYNITSRQSVARIYDHKNISGEQLNKLLYATANMVRTLSVYLLDPNNLLLNPEYIFYDYEREEYCFTYYPEGITSQNCEELFVYLSERIEPEDAESQLIIYRLCELAQNEGFLLKAELLDHEYEQIKGCDDLQGTGGEATESGKSRCMSEGRYTVADQEHAGDENDDLDDFDEESDRKKGGKQCKDGRSTEKRHFGKRTGKKRESDCGRKGSPVVALVLAVLFTVGTVGLLIVSLFVPLTQEVLFAVRSGMVFCLFMTIAAAIYGMVGSWKKSKAEITREAESAMEEHRNAMRRIEEA